MRVDKIEYRDIKLYIVRDDLYPSVGGGNKGRKMATIADDIHLKGCNAVVTTGGIQSNHCRAVAISAAENGWKCKLILHGEESRFADEGGNAKLMRMSGADIEFVNASEIGPAMNAAMAAFEQQGLKPYYLYGGGHTLIGGKAYFSAIDELSKFWKENSCEPDHIFLACGTGSTQAGIMAGLDFHNVKAEVSGISIARTAEQATKVTLGFYEELRAFLNIHSPSRNVNITDHFIAGGYESFNNDIVDVILDLARKNGIFLDPTYTGKAFWGMMESIKNKNIKGNIFFWHTGGIHNLLTATI